MDVPSTTHEIEGVRARARKAYVETYGCQMNVSDGELMQGVLAEGGYGIVGSAEEADVVLVNTCAIREHAEQRVLGRVGELNRLKRERPDLVIGVTGCMAQRLGEALLEKAPHVDLVLGPDSYRGLPEALARVRPDWHAGDAIPAESGSDEDTGDPVSASAPGEKDRDRENTARPERKELPVLQTDAGSGSGWSDRMGTRFRPDLAGSTGTHVRSGRNGKSRLALLDFEPHENYEGLEVRRDSSVGSWVPIQRGCNYRCTYCIVPYVRGPEKNRDPERIIDEVRSIAGQGIPEVTLLGQTVNSYRHGDWSFPRLLRAVARVDGIRRVRFTSPHPSDLTSDLVEVIADEPAVCRQLHLPAQSGHDRTLKRMLRRYTVATFLEKVEMVRSAIPDIALSTDIIVGFPGETREEYQATLDLMRTVRFDDAYLYKYSLRDGTPATRLPEEDFVDGDEAQRRLEELITLQRGIQAEINRSEVGRTAEVLVERRARSEGDMLGRTESNKVVAFPGSDDLLGRFLDVHLTRTTGATFVGEAVEILAEVARPA